MPAAAAPLSPVTAARRAAPHTPLPAADGYSGSDLAALCKEAAMMALRELGAAIATAPAAAVRPITPADFAAAAGAIKPSVSREQLQRFEAWTRDFGSPA